MSLIRTKYSVACSRHVVKYVLLLTSQLRVAKTFPSPENAEEATARNGHAVVCTYYFATIATELTLRYVRVLYMHV